MSDGEVPTTIEVLADRGGSQVVRHGSVVRRQLAPQSTAVHALLRHLDDVGFDGAPRFVGLDGDAEVLTYLDGLAAAVEAEQRRGRGLVQLLAEQGEPRQVEMVADGYLDELDARIAWTRANQALTR